MMYNIAWYARDGHLDLYPLISKRLEEKDTNIKSYFICNTDLDREHLQTVYNVEEPWVVARYIKENSDKIGISDDIIREHEREYGALPLVRGVWGALFQSDIPNEETERLFIAHIRCWREFLESNRIRMLVGEVPSVLSTCAAWLVCKRLNVDFVSFASIPIEERITLSGSWEGYSDYLEEKIKQSTIDKSSTHYRNALEYVDKMRTRPEKTKEVINLTKNMAIKRSPISLGQIRKLSTSWRRYKKRKEYHVYDSLKKQLLTSIKFHLYSNLYKTIDIFEKMPNPLKERYFLFPLHMYGEWSNYTWMGLGYSDQALVLRDVAACLPVGCKLYVKEHMANFGEKSPLFFRRIRKLRGVRLIDPYEDTFKLIKNSEGIVTLGSTVGYEAFIMKKPVITLGRPWYRNFPGIYEAKTTEELAELLQYVHRLEIATEEEIVKAIWALYESSFKGFKYPHPETHTPHNVNNFACAFTRRIESNL